MNIHLDKEEFTNISEKKSFGKFVIGSKLYGIDNENSDTDILNITHSFSNLAFSAFGNHHQFQYKGDNTDYLFIDIVTFIRNLVSGDSTINYELLFSKDFESSSLSWLSEISDSFRTYNVIKSYIGMVERDIKHFSKRVGSDRLSGIVHIKRGILFAKNMLNNESLDFGALSEFKYDNDVNLDDAVATNDFLRYSLSKVKDFRKNELNVAVENGDIKRFLDTDIQLYINKKLMEINEVDMKSFLSDSILRKLFNTNENLEMRY
jgi:predicted nucleotidyltransferase